MIQELIDFLSKIWDDVKPIEILNEYEVGIVYRLGSYHRNMEVGINLKIPFAEEFKKVSKQDDTKQLRTQTIMGTVATPIVCYYVKNARKYFEKVLGENESIVDDITASVVAENLTSEEPSLDDILKEVREQCSVYGLRVRNISYSTYDQVPTIRLIHDRDFEEA